MSLWVKVYTNFYTHRKTLRLRASLGNDAYWVPPRLWSYAAENQPDGNFTDYSDSELASAIGYVGDASSMRQALLQAGFLNPDRSIHDWQTHNSFHQVFAERASKAAQVRWGKEKERTKEKEGDKEETEMRGDEPSIASSMLGASKVAGVAGKSTAKAVPTSSQQSDDLWLAELKEDKAYRGIDVDREHAKMIRWCTEHGKQPTRRRFVGWLNRADKPMSTGPSRTSPPLPQHKAADHTNTL